jgi:hypothetical protein
MVGGNEPVRVEPWRIYIKFQSFPGAERFLDLLPVSIHNAGSSARMPARPEQWITQISSQGENCGLKDAIQGLLGVIANKVFIKDLQTPDYEKAVAQAKAMCVFQPVAAIVLR